MYYLQIGRGAPVISSHNWGVIVSEVSNGLMVIVTSSVLCAQTPKALTIVHVRVVGMGTPPGAGTGKPEAVVVSDYWIFPKVTPNRSRPSPYSTTVASLPASVTLGELAQTFGWSGPAFAAVGSTSCVCTAARPELLYSKRWSAIVLKVNA